jgi:hypothetical protein
MSHREIGYVKYEGKSVPICTMSQEKIIRIMTMIQNKAYNKLSLENIASKYSTNIASNVNDELFDFVTKSSRTTTLMCVYALIKFYNASIPYTTRLSTKQIGLNDLLKLDDDSKKVMFLHFLASGIPSKSKKTGCSAKITLNEQSYPINTEKYRMVVFSYILQHAKDISEMFGIDDPNISGGYDYLETNVLDEHVKNKKEKELKDVDLFNMSKGRIINEIDVSKVDDVINKNFMFINRGSDEDINDFKNAKMIVKTTLINFVGTEKDNSKMKQIRRALELQIKHKHIVEIVCDALNRNSKNNYDILSSF